MTDTPTPPRTAKATATRMRSAQEKKAALLRKAGWICIPPEQNKVAAKD